MSNIGNLTSSWRWALPVLGALALAGCNSSKPPQANNAQQPSGQVIAKVGNEDVTIHELQNEYRQLRVTPDKVNEQITRQVLEEITRRKALAQKAIVAGLDREPTVLLDMLRAREQVLATAILQRDVQAKFSGVGKAELDRYINSKPDIFAKRVRFDTDQININVAQMKPEFLESVKDASTLDMIEAKAAEANLPFSRGARSLYSGDMPPELLARLRERKETDIFFVRGGNNGSFFRVKAEAADPLGGEEAQARAQMMMRNETAQSEISKKADEAQITYFGEYAKLMEKPATAPEAAKPAEPAK